MIKDFIPSSSDSEIDDEANDQDFMVAAIERLKNDHYDNAERIKDDLKKIETKLGGQHLSAKRLIAAKSGLIEAVARAIILLHRFNELGVAVPILMKLHSYRLGDASSKVFFKQVYKDFCEELDKKLDGITDVKKLEEKMATNLYEKQRLLAIVEYAHDLCRTSKKLPTIAAAWVFGCVSHGIGDAYPQCSSVKLVEEVGKLRLVVEPPGTTTPLYFEL
ncbi:hypothetical protein GQ42DRAFT_165702 [Ramicandelaber brevisporus]|nr:hypothetical protein GQ42DRAFT_165702 [Ramicandelaber brevisporus]